MSTIIGLDLGKFKSVACAYDTATTAARFATAPTDPDGLRKLLEAERPALVVFATCTVAGWVADLCDELGLAYAVANPMHEAWSWRKVRRKTDRDDALKLARMAEVVVAHLGDARRFRTARQVSAYAGLVPRQFQSGEMDRKGRITRRGPGLLRKVLVEAAWLMQRYNGWAARTLQRIGKGQKTRRKQALVAVARKLLVRCWAMLKHGTAWDERLA